MTVEKMAWGESPDGGVDLYVLKNGSMEVSVATLGAVVVSLRVPDCSGRPGEVTLGYAKLGDYLADSCYFGALVGRVANRIGGARFRLGGREYELDRNHGNHHLHGGFGGFSTRVWQAEAGGVDGDPALRLTLESPDGDQGYPGNLMAEVEYVLTSDALRITCEARTDAPTPVNLTSHVYFNLDGVEPGPAAPSCLDHEVSLAASRVLETDEDLIPTGKLLDVEGTPLDFRESRRLGGDLHAADPAHPLLRAGRGYDHCYVLDEAGDGLCSAAVVSSPRSGRRMEMLTTCPCVQFYSGNQIPEGLQGRPGESYCGRSGLCLEAQEHVDAPNRPEFSSVTLLPGERFVRTTEYRFSAKQP